MLDQYFPLGLAEGDAFIGRKQEIERLKKNIQQGYHTLLLAPRRHGKTSLAKKVITSEKYPWVEIDFFVASNELSIEQNILKGVLFILEQLDAPERWLKILIDFFKKASKTWSVGIKGIKLELKPEHHKDVPGNILEALSALEHILQKTQKRVVLFFDEFQEISKLENNTAIEGSIRHFAQSSKYVVFIFSGSNRHMLQHMFCNESRPLYALCKEIFLTRLAPEEYCLYLNKIAKKTWKTPLANEVFEKIIEYTQCHPRYVYTLCMHLWDHTESFVKGPSVENVSTVWQIMIEERVKDFREILAKRPQGQIKILSLVALNEVDELSSQLAQSKLQMSSSAIVQATKILVGDDYLEKSANGRYKIIDPLLKDIFIRYGSDYFT
jgi:AAA+ ATPase superfamily predicted ATPase